MQLPAQVKYRLLHFKRQMLQLAAAKAFSVILLCQIFGVSRNTFYKYRRLDRAEKLDYFCCAPLHHGLAKSQEVIDAVLWARERFPGFGKKRLASHIRQQGMEISSNTVQRILRAYNKALPAAAKKRRSWKHFEAIAPNVIWAIDICYLYRLKKDGFDLYLITILDDHSRKVAESALFTQQTVVEVVQVLKDAVLKYGVPQVLVCDNGNQFTCSEFRRVCKETSLEVAYAPRHYPQYKGKLERFFRTTRQEMPRASSQELALQFHTVWINYYNQERVHSSVLDLWGQEHVPEFRFTWKQSAARALPWGVDLEKVFQVQRPEASTHTRQVKADLCISYKKQHYHFPQLNKGDLLYVKEQKENIQFFYQEQLLQTVVKPPSLRSACTRKVKSRGDVIFKRQRIQLGLPKNTQVIIVRQGQEHVFYANGEVVLRSRGQESVQQSI